ncbi:DUF4259 domain-containing protein [Ralstonia sp. SM1864_UCD524_TZ4]|uniref:DUF4259 domain-containing protein n=1 Tax=Ralstonia solanacearum TaxID=305 RepID=A0A0S4XAK5_RALSL|nr:DUF4259 domain-containing protein [Ralstonia pseudosolanacearum]CUV25761.1 conserved protein of unknown function [Ralstonia solanacearum]CUV34219.1 conserved protein of unknown function [Ralstonia solanacearum]CUV40028.1 conserved protein of unknown function [Ralstonia solanacearum]CUV61026.1 conserved protein of unknown function [Ralstonia solanacearum]
MGAWSHESFGNDDACDFAADVAETNDLSLVESAFDAVLAAGDDDLEAPEASQAVAAAEVVARLQGHWGVRNADSESIDAWIKRAGITPPCDIVHKARQALDRIVCEPSELLELWQESEDGDKWRDAVRELRARLDGAPAR